MRKGFIVPAALAAASMAQAIEELRAAEREARVRIENWYQDTRGLLTDLAFRLADYEAASADLAEELTRAQQGGSNQELIQRRRLAEYGAAFSLLASLRRAELLAAEISALQL